MNDAQSLTLALNGEWRGNHGTAPCPVCQPDRRVDQRALSIRSEGGRLLCWCHKTGCHFRDIIKAAGVTPAVATFDAEAARQADQKRATYEAEQRAKARNLWERSRPITGTKGERYLRSRGITCPLPSSLRWAVDAYHAPSARYVSAMVADVNSGGVHRTFFEKTGERLSRNAKMMQGPCAGGAVRLSERGGALAVCEGIETGLSLLSGVLQEPAEVWAALSTSGMQALSLPPAPGRLIVATDGDEPGRAAGRKLAERAAALGWRVSFLAAPDGRDWNDVLREQEAQCIRI
ncbi:toprim domain-containing protein [Cereibacter azotoformans]|uniref:Toprim domain-containing protein n=1 Tax=Cereibacter azotoformans TaxID=43057 RepID=A0A2T5JLL2_9RHOB|nr:toprim domain-containing protein [Cereibacter azotoformans]AXQ94006.1 virulence-associated protein E [Cereibacter sphaeroides]PTR07769.1 Toprim domain-containing protein [Cereibacter azotoformans]UIJ29530.1 toprim domain-containing protein [Cereibacter azotoformans]